MRSFCLIFGVIIWPHTSAFTFLTWRTLLLLGISLRSSPICCKNYDSDWFPFPDSLHDFLLTPPVSCFLLRSISPWSVIDHMSQLTFISSSYHHIIIILTGIWSISHIIWFQLTTTILRMIFFITLSARQWSLSIIFYS